MELWIATTVYTKCNEGKSGTNGKNFSPFLLSLLLVPGYLFLPGNDITDKVTIQSVRLLD